MYSALLRRSRFGDWRVNSRLRILCNMWKLILIAVGLIFASAAHAAERLTVVELFTSQACPNCPPANQLLADLAGREDVLALTWGVDYWDFMGWEDTFGNPAHTRRQRAYNAHLKRPGVFTPEMVIDGRFEVVGSATDKVMESLEQARSLDRPHFSVELKAEGGLCIVRLDGADPGKTFRVRAIWYKSRESVNVSGGDNAGRTLDYVNVVKGSEIVGTWAGEDKTFRVELGGAADLGADHLAILVEDITPGGPLYGSGKLALSHLGLH